MEFLLIYVRKEQSYSMNGGPLTRSWTREEWDEFVKRQKPEEQEFYIEWAKEAREYPNEDVPRKLK